jgi:hypothetical protein
MYSSSGIVRIRKPNPNDVLSGRGGGINSHPGNKTFRDWVRERKDGYNLAITKAEKAEIAHEVIYLVRSLNPPGRFLQRDPNSVTGYSWWIEVDSNRALAKTSQALREGAPQIRAAHKEELGEKMERARKSRRRSRSVGASPLQSPPKSPPKSPVVDDAIRTLQHNVEQARTQADQEERAAMPTIIVPPLVSNRQFEESYMKPPKKGRFARIIPEINQTSETPPLTSVPTLTFQEPSPTMIKPELPPRNVDARDSMNTLIRSHSLALSDFSHGEMKEEDLSEDFVDPFADESDILSKIVDPSTTPQRSPRVLRTLGRDENKMEPSTTSMVGRNSNLSSRYVVSPELKARKPVKCPTTTNPRAANCFCDCNRPFSEGGGKCICSDLADHLLHRADGLELYLYEDHRIV